MKAVDICRDLMHTAVLPFISALERGPALAGIRGGQRHRNWIGPVVKCKEMGGMTFRVMGGGVETAAASSDCPGRGGFLWAPERVSLHLAASWKEGTLRSWTGLAGFEAWLSTHWVAIGSHLSSVTSGLLCQWACSCHPLSCPPQLL